MLWATTLRFLPAGCIGFLISGWLVGRLHPSHPAAMLIAFTVSVVTLFAFSWEIVVLIGGPRAIPYPLRSVFFMELSFFWHAGFMVVPAFILLGGTTSVPRRKHAAKVSRVPRGFVPRAYDPRKG